MKEGLVDKPTQSRLRLAIGLPLPVSGLDAFSLLEILLQVSTEGGGEDECLQLLSFSLQITLWSSPVVMILIITGLVLSDLNNTWSSWQAVEIWIGVFLSKLQRVMLVDCNYGW